MVFKNLRWTSIYTSYSGKVSRIENWVIPLTPVISNETTIIVRSRVEIVDIIELITKVLDKGIPTLVIYSRIVSEKFYMSSRGP